MIVERNDVFFNKHHQRKEWDSKVVDSGASRTSQIRILLSTLFGSGITHPTETRSLTCLPTRAQLPIAHQLHFRSSSGDCNGDGQSGRRKRQDPFKGVPKMFILKSDKTPNQHKEWDSKVVDSGALRASQIWILLSTRLASGITHPTEVRSLTCLPTRAQLPIAHRIHYRSSPRDCNGDRQSGRRKPNEPFTDVLKMFSLDSDPWSPKLKINGSLLPNFLVYFCFWEDLLSTFSKINLTLFDRF